MLKVFLPVFWKKKQNNKREALIARGKRVDWKVVPALVYDLEELQNGIVKVLDTLIVHYEDYIQSVPLAGIHVYKIDWHAASCKFYLPVLYLFSH